MPLLAEQVQDETGVPISRDAGQVSVALKPVPVTATDAPTGADVRDRVTTCGITVNVAVAEPAGLPPPVTLIT